MALGPAAAGRYLRPPTSRSLPRGLSAGVAGQGGRAGGAGPGWALGLGRSGGGRGAGAGAGAGEPCATPRASRLAARVAGLAAGGGRFLPARLGDSLLLAGPRRLRPESGSRSQRRGHGQWKEAGLSCLSPLGARWRGGPGVSLSRPGWQSVRGPGWRRLPGGGLLPESSPSLRKQCSLKL